MVSHAWTYALVAKFRHGFDGSPTRATILRATSVLLSLHVGICTIQTGGDVFSRFWVSKSFWGWGGG